MKIFIRRTILFLLYLFYFVFRIFTRRKEIVVLMYHSVASSDWFFSVSPGEFERQIRYLKKHCNPVRLNDMADFVRGERGLPSYSVAVTFDDGYEDFYKNALPILKNYGMPATLFVMAGEEPDRKELGSNFQLLGWNRLKEIQASGLIDIGSHAMTHKKLTRLTVGAAE